jgi:hypothetical protein
LDICGFRKEPVPNNFFKQDQDTKHLALLFPGLNYTNQMPAMYYPARLLESIGTDVLRVNYAYNQRPEYETLSFSGKMQWLLADVTAAFQIALSQRSYDKITLVGKSLGTLAMGHSLTHNDFSQSLQCVWLTPLLRNERLREQIKKVPHKAFFVIGTADPFYDAGLLKELETSTSGKSVIIPGADHGLEIHADMGRSLQALREWVKELEIFLKK